MTAIASVLDILMRLDARRRLSPVGLITWVSGMHCPACRSRAWLVGRRVAECARCGYAAPLAEAEP